MHSRHKGKSRSVHPEDSKVDEWLEYSKEEIVNLVVELAKQGKSASEIGMILRDQYGIPSVKLLTKKTITQILAEHDLKPEISETLMSLFRRALRIRKHLEKHKKDLSNKYALQCTESKIRRLVNYYKRKKILKPNFVYDADKIELLLR
jgi:small subunit ribosomal protein S15